jgi:hypothetical protein|tara:strand:+ start:812 stop:919 length:108 start_codon:yes stop_codon:yes gene_type:complete
LSNFLQNYLQRNDHKKKEKVTVVADQVNEKDIFEE